MRYADLHTHTFLCKHAVGEPEEYLRTATEKNLAYYGISDHAPWPTEYDTESRMNPARWKDYLAIVDRIRRKAEGTGTKVLLGLETDFVPGKMEESDQEFAKYDFDYLIGSIHFIRDFAFDNPDLISIWERPGMPDDVWNTYLSGMVEFAERGGFQIIGHADLPKKFGYRSSDGKRVLELFHAIFETAAKKGIAVELNTSGLFKPVGEIYPSLEILKTARECGMRITFGSDAHAPGDIGRAFDKARALAEAAGYRSILAFEKKVPVELPFD